MMNRYASFIVGRIALAAPLSKHCMRKLSAHQVTSHQLMWSVEKENHVEGDSNQSGIVSAQRE